MPPTSNVRKSSIATDANRRQSGRQARTSTSRPFNYYARPYGSQSGPVDEPVEADPPGFFPAITYFTDAITALPKETQRHISLMKEVEAKVYGPTDALTTLSTHILKLPTPPPRYNQYSAQGLLSFTANNSATASLAGSLINGHAPNLDSRVSDVLEGAKEHMTEEQEQADLQRRSQFRDLRQLIGTMLVNLDEKNNVMAEANRLLAQQLSRMDSVMPHVENEFSDEARFGSGTHWAYADNRVKKQTAPAANERARRDVAATTNLAAAAAAVHDNDIAAARGQATRESKKTRNQHVDSDFDDRPTKRAAPTKRKEALDMSKATGLGITNGNPNPKRRKVEKATAPAMERSASNLKNGRAGNTTPRSTPQAEPVKQRKKPGPAPGFVPVKKRNQAALHSGANSPAVASSPVLNTVLPDLSNQRPSSSRVRQNSSTSNLQHSLLAGEPLARPSRPSSVAGTVSVNGANTHEAHEAPEETTTTREVDNIKTNTDQETRHPRTSALKHEDTAMSDANNDQPTRGRTSNISTPLTDTNGTGMLRTRSNRGIHSNPTSASLNNPSNNPTNSASSTARPSHSRTPEAGSSSSTSKRHHQVLSHHRKSGSGAHILKQIASFNRSPDMDRHRSVGGEPTSDVDSDSDNNHVREGFNPGSASGSASGSVAGKRSSSRRSAPRGVSTIATVAAASAAAQAANTSGRSSRASRRIDKEAEYPPPRSAQPSMSRNRTPEVEDDPGLEADEEDHHDQEPDEMDEEEPLEAIEEPNTSPHEHLQQQQPIVQRLDEEEEDEEEDPHEPKYCYCDRGSFGEMIACDNEDCAIEWFHLECTDLARAPAENGESWLE